MNEERIEAAEAAIARLGETTDRLNESIAGMTRAFSAALTCESRVLELERTLGETRRQVDEHAKVVDTVRAMHRQLLTRVGILIAGLAATGNPAAKEVAQRILDALGW